MYIAYRFHRITARMAAKTGSHFLSKLLIGAFITSSIECPGKNQTTFGGITCSKASIYLQTNLWVAVWVAAQRFASQWAAALAGGNQWVVASVDDNQWVAASVALTSPVRITTLNRITFAKEQTKKTRR
jgi:hypothetical protein